MKKGSVIYISNERISVVSAEVKRDVLRVDECFHIELKEGTILNGVIIDDNEMKIALKGIYSRGIHEASLIVDSAKILAKSAVIPKMKEKEILQFVKDELSTIDNNSEDIIYDFSYLGEDVSGKGASKILCVGVERQFIESYLDVFNSAGITILSIDYAINVLINLVKELHGFLDKTYAISQIDGQNLLSVLFINNEYALTNRSRIFANRGTAEFENEIVSAISQLKQFASSSHQDQLMSDIYFFGLNEDERTSLFTRIRSSLDLTASELPNSKSIYAVKNQTNVFDINDYVYPIGYFKRK